VPRLSCILPVMDRLAEMEPTLVSLLENRPADCEILLVLTTPYDDPYELGGEVRFLQAPPRSDLLAAMNFALGHVEAPFIHLLSVGMAVTPQWADRALAHFTDPHIAAVAPVICDVADHNTILSGGWEYDRLGGPWQLGSAELNESPLEESAILSLQKHRTARSIIGPLYQAAFYRTMALELLGGRLPMACGTTWSDVDLGLMLHYIGYDAVVEKSSVVLGSANAIDRTPALGYTTGRHSEELFFRNSAHASWFDVLVRHPLQVAGELAGSVTQPRKLLQTIGRASKWTNNGQWKKHRASLEDSRRAAASLLAQVREAQTRIDRAHGPGASKPYMEQAPTRETTRRAA
jgi:hypothetical protein